MPKRPGAIELGSFSNSRSGNFFSATENRYTSSTVPPYAVSAPVPHSDHVGTWIPPACSLISVFIVLGHASLDAARVAAGDTCSLAPEPAEQRHVMEHLQCILRYEDMAASAVHIRATVVVLVLHAVVYDKRIAAEVDCNTHTQRVTPPALSGATCTAHPPSISRPCAIEPPTTSTCTASGLSSAMASIFAATTNESRTVLSPRTRRYWRWGC